MLKRISFVAFFFLIVAPIGFGQANGKLQIHFIDVGQGAPELCSFLRWRKPF